MKVRIHKAWGCTGCGVTCVPCAHCSKYQETDGGTYYDIDDFMVVCESCKVSIEIGG